MPTNSSRGSRFAVAVTPDPHSFGGLQAGQHLFVARREESLRAEHCKIDFVVPHEHPGAETPNQCVGSVHTNGSASYHRF